MSTNSIPPAQMVIDATQVGIQGPRGPEGLTNYEVAVRNGFTGTEAEWVAATDSARLAAETASASAIAAETVAVDASVQASESSATSVAAKDASVTAKNASQEASTQAEVFRDEAAVSSVAADAARTEALGARDTAVGAQDAAEVALEDTTVARDATLVANTQAQAASTQAIDASALAVSARDDAAASENAASTSETNAAGSEAGATASRDAALGYRNEAEGFHDAALTYRNAAEASATSADDRATNAAASLQGATDAQTSAELAAAIAEAHNAAAAASSASALTSRDQTETLRQAAETAAADVASAIVYQDLAAIAETKAVNAVDVLIWDTTRDDDGGAWRHDQSASWYIEPLGTPTRGTRREAPANSVIVAESNKLTIYDGDDPALPMWKVIEPQLGGNPFWFKNFAYPASALAAKNGRLYIGLSGTSAPNAGLLYIDFAADRYGRYAANGVDHISTGGIAQINSGTSLVQNGTAGLVNPVVNDIAVTVRSGAPIDPVSGLPVPTIAVATDGGLSVIRHDGMVVNSAGTTSVKAVSTTREGVWWSTATNLIFASWAVVEAGGGFGTLVGSTTSGAAAVDLETAPRSLATSSNTVIIGGPGGMQVITPNYSDFASSASVLTTPTSITALAHDTATGLVHAGTAGGRLVFDGADQIAAATGSVTTAISASGDMVVEQ